MTGAELKRARLRKGISQAQISRETTITPANICRIEKGQRDEMLKRWQKILNTYGFAIVSIEPNTTPDNWNDYTEQA